MKTTFTFKFFSCLSCLFTVSQAETVYPDAQLIRYNYKEDYNKMDTWDSAREFCTSKGLKLTTRSQLCPNGPLKEPVGGAITFFNEIGIKNHWVAVSDVADQFIEIGTAQVENLCRTHAEAYGPKTWGQRSKGHKKTQWSNNQVYCSTEGAPTPEPTSEPTLAPTPVPTPAPTNTIKGAYDFMAGCSNQIKFASKFLSSEGKECDSCHYCDDSTLSTLFHNKVKNTCIECSEEDKKCNTLRVTTTFDKAWSMKVFSLSPSTMTADFDPKKVVVQGSNDGKTWITLHESALSFMVRDKEQNVDLTNEKHFKYYSVSFEHKNVSSKMYVGTLNIVQVYGEDCVSKIHSDITGDAVSY